MGKNKQKGKKPKNVFQVANKPIKIKSKAKAVTTALKHVSSSVRTQTEPPKEPVNVDNAARLFSQL
uniref:Ribosomal biogenesis factor n=1 Tax=Oryzias sinensis TaxID=183150 RepID=A0A8C7YX75_9TELE